MVMPEVPQTITTERSQAASEIPTWQLSPYALLRFAGKPYEELENLKFSKSVALFDEMIALQKWLEEQKGYLCDVLLFKAIGQCQGKQRSQLVALKRDMHNERILTEKQWQLLGEMEDGRIFPEVTQYYRHLDELRQVTAQARATFQVELADKRRLLQASLQDENFQKALQIASPSLMYSIGKYIEADPQQFGRSERRAEEGAMRYFTRMTAKTSPFSRFGPVSLASVQKRAEQAIRVSKTPMQMQSKVRFNLAVITQIAHALSAAPDIKPYLQPYLNETYYVEDDLITFVRPIIYDDHEVYSTTNQLKRGKYIPPMRAVVEFLEATRQEPLSWQGLVSQLAQQGILGTQDTAVVETFLNKLLHSGLLRNDFRLPSNSPLRLEILHRRLGEIKTPTAQQAAVLIDELISLGTQFTNGKVAERQKVFKRTQAIVSELVHGSQAGSSAKRSRTDYWIEDAIVSGMQTELSQQLFAPVVDDLSLFLECIHSRDDGSVNRPFLVDIFTNHFGNAGQCDNLMKFATHYMHILFQGKLDDFSQFPRGVATINKSQIYAKKLQTLAEVNGGMEYDVPAAVLHDLIDEFGGLLPEAASATLHLQIAAPSWEAVEAGDYLVVFNHSLPGFGHFFTRYCYLFEDQPGVPPLFNQIRAAVEQLQTEEPNNQELVEILSILDHNAQIHPLFTGRQIVPPGEHSELPLSQQIPVRSLGLQHNAEIDSLEVYLETENGRENITPIYMGFFHLMALPSFHRILAQLGPTIYHMERVRPYDYYETLIPRSASQNNVEKVRHYPRIRIGRFVFQREMWAFAPEAVPQPEQHDDFEAFFLGYCWAKQHGLPAETFVRINRDLLKANVNMHIDHKPMLVDFENYLSLKTLFHLLKGEHILSLHIEEMLPNPRQLFFENDGKRYAVEFQMEFNRGRYHA